MIQFLQWRPCWRRVGAALARIGCASLVWATAAVAADAGLSGDSAPVPHSGAAVYHNPLVPQRADPWVLRDGGNYYFVATVPAFDRIELRRATTINGLATAPVKVIWRKHRRGLMGAHIWAPELHRIDGAWYIYFAAGETERPWNIRIYALRNRSANPLQGEWEELGQIKTPLDTFSLDATTFAHNGKRYLLWAQSDANGTYNSALLLAEMTSPTTIKPPVVTLSEPEFDWETAGFKVNEGPAVLQKNGRVFVSYSAGATDSRYAMGLLWADVDADLLDKHSWHKSPQPVFYTNAAVKRFGPGHNSFTVAEDGITDLMVYHARDYRDIKGDPLRDPNRATRVRVLHWDKHGMPDFRQAQGD
ncbi:glycoside hydrolase family 43 protein [Microbulbifer sp. SAOS-129_SWC]|uniref:glycoside hydrolase family 43 protein n=1 Tax=Microbulbifer sp. SAOS-129_SWC TaxID=3145235 RepID=UPI0032162C0C